MDNAARCDNRTETRFRACWVLRLVVVAIATLLFVGHVAVRAEDTKRAKFVRTWGTKGDKPGEFYSPIGIAIGPKDEVYVTDLNNARLQIFNTDGKYLRGFDLPRDTPKRKSSQAGGIALDDKGQVFVSFMVQDKVRVYSGSGELIREWGKRGKGDGELFMPGGMVFGADGSLYVADQANHRIQRFSEEGRFLGRWGEHGTKAGQFGGNETAGSRFAGPHFIARDSKGRIYTTEGSLGRIQQFTAEGKSLSAWGNKGTQPGGFGSLQTGFSKNTFGPIVVAVDKRDRVWISSLNDRVQAFTTDGKLLLGIGGTGEEPGEFARPHGMAFDSQGLLYVCDAGNQRIQVFAIPETSH